MATKIFSLGTYDLEFIALSEPVTTVDPVTAVSTTRNVAKITGPGVAVGMLAGAAWKHSAMNNKIVERGGLPIEASFMKKMLPWATGSEA